MPRVSVRISLRRPIRPRVGTWNSSRTRPEPWLTILIILPLRIAELLDDDAEERFRAVDHQELERLLAARRRSSWSGSRACATISS